jgi:hypothetical protein
MLPSPVCFRAALGLVSPMYSSFAQLANVAASAARKKYLVFIIEKFKMLIIK